MIKIFTTNKDGKIELTKDELKQLLDEAYWEGYRANTSSWIYQSPNSPYWYSSTTSDKITLSNTTSDKITLNSTISADTIIKNNELNNQKGL